MAAWTSKDDKRFILDDGSWPHWPMLPVKRWVDRQLQTAVLWAPEMHRDKVILHHASVFDLPKTVELFQELPVTTYASIDAMLADGWVVD